jgi:CHAP domain
MRSRGISSLVWGIFFVAVLGLANRPSVAANCALYVRAETGVALYGAGGGWWDEAAGRYQRGQIPEPRAILVFKRTGYMHSGHVALVTRIVGAHEILVDHANWYHGTVSRGTSVLDTSPNHDWTRVAVLDLRSGKHGRDNPTFGFIYPAEPSAAPAGLVHLVAAAEYLDAGTTESRHRVHRVWTAHTPRFRAHPSAD